MDGELKLKVKVFDVEQGQNEVVISEGLAKSRNIDIGDRVRVRANGKSIVALVDHSKKYLNDDEVGLFDEVASALDARKHDCVFLSKEQRPASLDYIRKKLDGVALTPSEIQEIISNVMDEKFSLAELVAFVSAVYVRGANTDEIVALTDAIYASGESMHFSEGRPVVSEHSIGGVAGDRVSMLIVPILASLGFLVPKTATRAISSASGTADAMECYARVDLKREEVEKVVKSVGGCLVWGGGVNMAVADDKLIKVRQPLRLDPHGLLLASILAKKKAEGASHVLLDIPYGHGAKIDSFEDAHQLATEFKTLGARIGLEMSVIITDGSEPMISVAGPALEARAVLEALSGKGYDSIVEKACVMSGLVIEKFKGLPAGKGREVAEQQVKSGAALAKLREIIKAQGGNPAIKPEDIEVGDVRATVHAPFDGRIAHIDNKGIFKACRALGAPSYKGAGIILKVKTGQDVHKGDELFELVTNSKEALDYTISKKDDYKIVEIREIILDVV
ncbi:MAG: thymidine phosphorylase [Candidatus Micrarchaeia archaeon]|jgi:AMP phosphorylase